MTLNENWWNSPLSRTWNKKEIHISGLKYPSQYSVSTTDRDMQVKTDIRAGILGHPNHLNPLLVVWDHTGSFAKIIVLSDIFCCGNSEKITRRKIKKFIKFATTYLLKSLVRNVPLEFMNY